MTIVLELEPEQVSQLEVRSKAAGRSIQEYLLQQALPESPAPSQLLTNGKPLLYEEWLELLYRAPNISSDYPPPTDESLRREEIYDDRN